MKIYMVGGAVRDTLLGIEPKDKDYVVVGATPEDMLDLGYSQVGASFPVFLHPETGEEYALARTERKTGVGYNGFDVVYDTNVTLEQDLLRRDLTINSIAMDDDGNIIDPYNGQQDLKARILRHTSEAFAEDPVRVLRTCRFAARYNAFTIHADTVELMKTIAHELNYVPRERIWAEFEKGLSEQSPTKMLEALATVDAFGIECLRPFNQWYRFKTIIDTAIGVDTRFALIASSFTGKDYQDLRVPTSAVLHSKILNEYAKEASQYNVADSFSKVLLLDRLAAFSSDVKINALVAVLAPFAYQRAVKSSLQMLLDDVKNLRANVNAAEIATQYKDGKEIAEAIRRARIELLDAR